jgi:trimeric autotransporter adhesin
MYRTHGRLAVFMLVCLSVVSAAAATSQADQTVPRLVKFTGVVAGGHGPMDLTFAFYADEASETPLWTETQRGIVEETGRYTVVLGATRTEGLPRELFAGGEARWVGVQAEGRAEQPRVLLVSVPYALKAADADTVGGKPVSAFVLAGSTTGVGTDGLTYVNPQTLKTGLSAAGLLPQATSGTPGYLGMFTSTTDLGNSVTYQSGNNIGVGTISPVAAFHSVAASAPGALFDVYSNSLSALPVVYRAARVLLIRNDLNVRHSYTSSPGTPLCRRPDTPPAPWRRRCRPPSSGRG